jgi:hypothetical protein
MARQAVIVLILMVLVAIAARPQSSTESSAPGVTPQVQPALPQVQLAPRPEQDAPSRAKVQADDSRRQAQEQEEQRLVQETRSRGYWIDPTTKLMWEGRDNGIAVTWHKAASYCRDLRLGGYSDWRLATLDELATLVDQGATCPDRVGHTETCLINLGNVRPHVRGGLSLTGNPWSSIREINRFGKPYGDGWFFDFVISKPSGDLQHFRNVK